MPNRHAWRFPFPVSVVRAAAARCADHHRERRDWWSRELGVAEDKLRAEGMTFREQPVTGGSRLDAVIDPTLAGRVTECRGKAREHAAAEDDYRAILAGLDRLRDDDTVDLDAEDIRYFGMVGREE